MSSVVTGLISDHVQPSAERLYLLLSSRCAKFHTSERRPHTSVIVDTDFLSRLHQCRSIGSSASAVAPRSRKPVGEGHDEQQQGRAQGDQTPEVEAGSRIA